MNKVVLLTGFSPFGGSKINPSYEACKIVAKEKIRGYTIIAKEIQLDYNIIKTSIEDLIERYRPKIAISTGQSGRSKVALERVAINIADSKVPYNCGYMPHDELLEKDGPVGYFSSLPIRRIYNNLKENKIPCEISNSAGTYGCNQVFYHLMHYINEKGYEIMAGFIHIPSVPEQALEKDIPSMCLELSAKAIKIAVETTIEEVEKKMKSGNK